MGYFKTDRETRDKLKKYIKLWPFLVVLAFLIAFVRNFSNIIQAQKRIESQRLKVEKLNSENEELKNRNKSEQSEQFIEKQLRDKLGLAKEGEIILVLPDENTLRKLAPPNIEEDQALPDPNWKKWLKLFI
ncbi:septum formation initiator family protein [Candidatus Woesebacteria bacterium]|nr:septum formation initiator family protein [Candidatus Woesebacteria bacterium]